MTLCYSLTLFFPLLGYQAMPAPVVKTAPLNACSPPAAPGGEHALIQAVSGLGCARIALVFSGLLGSICLRVLLLLSLGLRLLTLHGSTLVTLVVLLVLPRLVRGVSLGVLILPLLRLHLRVRARVVSLLVGGSVRIVGACANHLGGVRVCGRNRPARRLSTDVVGLVRLPLLVYLAGLVSLLVLLVGELLRLILLPLSTVLLGVPPGGCIRC